MGLMPKNIDIKIFYAFSGTGFLFFYFMIPRSEKVFQNSKGGRVLHFVNFEKKYCQFFLYFCLLEKTTQCLSRFICSCIRPNEFRKEEGEKKLDRVHSSFINSSGMKN